jgi:hypothetical protein
METHCLVPLMLNLLLENPTKFGRKLEHLKACVVNLLRFFAVCKREPRQMSPEGLRSIEKCACAYLDHWKKAGGHCVVKHHMFFHIAQLAKVVGNPRWFHTYADEEENRVMGKIAQKLHGSKRFYITFLQRVKMDML